MSEMRGENASVSEAIHRLATRAMDHPWTASQIASALASEFACLMLHSAAGASEAADAKLDLTGFVLGRRVAVDLVEIDLVAVDPDHRRQGIGRDLLEELIASEAAVGVREFNLELASQNAAALALYSSAGFVVVGRRSRYYPDGDDALLLTRTLEEAPMDQPAASAGQRRNE